MPITVNIESQLVVQTAAQWAADNTVYGAKRILITSDATYTLTDQRKFKIADGVQTWSNLDYFPDPTALAAQALSDAQAYADLLVVGLWDDRGSFDASGGSYPATGGSGAAGAIKKGDIWTISVAGTLPTGQVVEIGDTVRALIDTPGNTEANWAIQQNNIGYVPENVVNKDIDGTLAANSDTRYASQKATKTYVDTQIATRSTRWTKYCCFTVLAAPADSTSYLFTDIPDISIGTTARPFRFGIAGNINEAAFTLSQSTNASPETINIYLRNTTTATDFLIGQFTSDFGTGVIKAFVFSGLSIAVNTSDDYSIKILTPAFGTNPGNWRGGLTLYGK